VNVAPKFPVGTLAIAKERSGNEKLGDCATTYAAQQSCPSSCVFADGGGCYAETGRVGKFVTEPLNTAAQGLTALDVAYAEAEEIDALPPGTRRPLRLHTVGDCKTDQTARIVSGAAERYMERSGGPVFTYTHAWRDVDRESWGRVSVLASCETLADVVEARLRGYATAIVTETHPTEKLYSPANAPTMAHLPCPAQTRGRSCSSCGLCFNDRRLYEAGYSIAFALHGIPLTVRRAKLALRSPDDPTRRVPAEDRLRELLAERPDLTARQAAVELVMNEPYVGQLLAFLRGEAKHPSVLRRERYDRRKVAA
jgi:hypothetical protein